MEISGKVKVIGTEQSVGATFKKRELVVETEETYPQFISINFVQDKCDLLNSLSVGQEVIVGINLRGREWTNPQGEVKYFNDIQGWNVKGGAVNNVTVNEPQHLGAQNEPSDVPF